MRDPRLGARRDIERDPAIVAANREMGLRGAYPANGKAASDNYATKRN